jgi:glycosyltransferase involved in cell wall biosynthesis
MLGRSVLRGKRIIGNFAWELPDLPPDWITGLRHVHEIWVPSTFNAQAFRRHTDRPVRIVGYPVSSAERQVAMKTKDAGEPFTVLTAFNMASGYCRKNPVASVQAFRAAFGNSPKARLILKTHHIAAYPPGMAELSAAIDGAPNIRVMDCTLPRTELDALVASSDAIMSLHRSEGFGLPLAEAMALGVPAVATGWSGNMDFMTDANSCPVSHSFVAARDPAGGYDYPDQSWADPSVEHAAERLRWLYDNPEERLRIGRTACQNIATNLSMTRYADCLAELLPRGSDNAAPGAAGLGNTPAQPR